MRTKNLVFSVFTLLLFVSYANAQVTGVVADDFGPVAGALVTVEESGASTETNEDGAFSIDAVIGNSLIVMNPETLAEKTYPIAKLNMGKLVITDAAVVLEDVLVLGYDQTVTKEESVGATTTVGSENFEGRPTVSFLDAVQGTAPGVMIQTNSGSPGSAKIDAQIRGRSSINSNTEPLYVIDGVISGSNQFRNLNQEDIESVSILRDAHATAIYGNNGANGVIVITTKSGRRNQDLKVNLTTSYGIFTLPNNRYNVTNAKQQLTLQKLVGSGFGSTLTDEQIANWKTNTNWREVFFSPGINNKYNLSFTQGGKNVSSYASLGYMEVEGMVPTTDFKRFTARAKIDGKTDNERLEYGINIAPSYSKRHQLDAETRDDIQNNVIQNPLHGSLLGLSYIEAGQYSSGQALYDAISSNFSGGKYIHVLEDILRSGSLPNQYNEFSILANGYLSYKFTDNITARTKLSADYKHQQRMFARAPGSYLAIVVAKGRGDDYGGFERIWNYQDLTFSTINSLHYDKTFNDAHKLSLAGYVEYVKAHSFYSQIMQTGLDPKIWQLGAGVGYIPRDGDKYVPRISASSQDGGSFSYFSVLDYDYMGKYGVGANIRRDASFRFLNDLKWGTFWSVAGRWNIDKESFLEDVDFINMLKLRASYGSLGNSILRPVPRDYNPLFIGLGDALSSIEAGESGDGYMNTNSYLTKIGNDILQWEVVKQANIGLDWILFNNRLEGNIDFYNKRTEKLFDNILLSAITGQYGIRGNNGELENKGVELNLRYKLIQNKDFNLTVFANTAYNKNKILRIDSEDLKPGQTVNAVGGPIEQWYVYKYLGVNAENGNMLFEDANGEATEKPDPEADARLTGKTRMPKWLGGFGFNADLKGFYLNVMFSYQTDVWKKDNQLIWLYDSSASSIEGYAVSADLLNAWTPDNKGSEIPALLATNQNMQGASDRFIKDASFLKLRSVSFGYDFPRRWLNKTFISKMSVYAHGENLTWFSKWKGFDPEGYENVALGIYPSPRTISLGFNVEF